MSIREVTVSGLEYVGLATRLLQRARLADPEAGQWEAADLQWWWRSPRRSDEVGQRFWIDEAGPMAAFVLTEWRRAWGLDPIVVPGSSVPLAAVFASALETIDALELDAVDVLVRDDDRELRRLLSEAGFAESDDRDGTTWMHAAERPAVSDVADGFEIVDRVSGASGPHPMRLRNGEHVEARLRECSLYDPTLDLAVAAPDGEIAGYALFWHDALTGVGLVEPMRVEDAYQRRGLARALLTEGLERLAQRGAGRLKVSYSTDAARALYTGAGFRVTSTSTTYAWRRST
ncbi:MAG: GNAT family N-acetyltransferase [Gaiellaceae bacterium]